MLLPSWVGVHPCSCQRARIRRWSAENSLSLRLSSRRYVGDVPPAISKPLIAQYKKQYSRTYVSYAGGTTDTPGTYLRIDGPQAWIEFAVQSTHKGSSHYHSVTAPG